VSKLEEWTNTIQCGDCLKLMRELPDGCIDLVVTDPPYGKEFMYVWENLSEQSNRLLKKTGWLLTYSGSLYLPEVLTSLSKYMIYRAIIIVLHAQRNFCWRNKMIDGWKPVLLYGFDNLEDTPMQQNVLWPSSQDKRFHKWG